MMLSPVQFIWFEEMLGFYEYEEMASFFYRVEGTRQ